jgi:hypothetical protein
MDEISKETFDALKNVLKAEDLVAVSIVVKSFKNLIFTAYMKEGWRQMEENFPLW